ncbi:DMT family transporter [Desulfamplus magnetovallimortis]|nr:DMT family transporter [Desulfamplus magnetovallimortis]
MKHNKIKGILLIILAASSFGCIPLFATTAYKGGFNPFSFSLFRCMFTAAIIFCILKAQKKSIAIRKDQILPVFNASFFGYFLMMLTLFASYNHMATGLATTLHFIYPVATMAGAVLFYKEKASFLQIGALAISIIGIYFLVGIDTSGDFTFTGFMLALVSGLFYAYYILVVSHGTLKKMGSFFLVFYITLFNTVTLTVTSLATGNLSLDITLTGIMATVMVALISSVIGMVAFQAGLQEISATTATILSTFEVLTSLVIGISLLGEILSYYQIAGSILIIFSVVAVGFAEKKED